MLANSYPVRPHLIAPGPLRPIEGLLVTAGHDGRFQLAAITEVVVGLPFAWRDHRIRNRDEPLQLRFLSKGGRIAAGNEGDLRRFLIRFRPHALGEVIQ